MRTSLVLLLLLSVSLACTGQISQYVPAVVGSGGGLVNITVSLSPGEGGIYVDTEPRIGISTQESVRQAVSYAYAASGNKESCDVFVTFRAHPSTTSIDGPSAGTALAVMTYALLENKSIRGDTVVTGSIDSAGNVGPVGGLYEKARGAAAVGAEYFITPVETLYEVLLLDKVESEYRITVLEARRVDEVIGFMLENKDIVQQPMTARMRETPDLPDYDTSGMESFGSVAQRFITLEEEVVDALDGDSTETKEIKEFFRNEVQRQRGVMEQGYLFSAANEAFLNYIDLSTIQVVISGEADLPRKKGDVGKCLTNISRPALTDENFEWVVGADLRQVWAYDKYESTETDGELLVEEKFIRYNELMYGEAWCHVAEELLSAAPEGGQELNESAWKPIAESSLSDAHSMGTTMPETTSRLSIAEESYGKGFYGAAIYDATYVIKMEEAYEDLANGIDAETEVPDMLNDSRSSLWGRIYHSQAAFLHELNDSNSAYRILKLAEGLDEATGEMIEESQIVEEEPKEEPECPDCSLYFFGFAALLFLFVVYVLLTARAWRHGR